MFLSFKDKSNQRQDKENPDQDRVANSIVHKCIKAQEQCAAFMQRQTERLSGKVKKFLLVLFFLLGSGYSLYLISESLISHGVESFSITPIKIPKHADKAGDKNTPASITISKAEYEKIHRFKLYMDSLAKNSSGKRLYDSLLLRRPGLMDSIMIIQEMYNAKN